MSDNNEIKNGDKPAFAWIDFPNAPGCSKRELFAAMALQGIMAKGDSIYYRAAKMAVDAADALIAELEKPRQE